MSNLNNDGFFEDSLDWNEVKWSNHRTTHWHVNYADYHVTITKHKCDSFFGLEIHKGDYWPIENRLVLIDQENAIRSLYSARNKAKAIIEKHMSQTSVRPKTKVNHVFDTTQTPLTFPDWNWAYVGDPTVDDVAHAYLELDQNFSISVSVSKLHGYTILGVLNNKRIFENSNVYFANSMDLGYVQNLALIRLGLILKDKYIWSFIDGSLFNVNAFNLMLSQMKDKEVDDLIKELDHEITKKISLWFKTWKFFTRKRYLSSWIHLIFPIK